MRKVVLILYSIVLLISCSKDDEIGCNNTVNTFGVDQTQLEKDVAAIDAYLLAKEITAIEHESGLRYVITTVGEGGSPTLCQQVFATYEGRLLSDNTVFDSNEQGIAFYLNGLILGWKIGFAELKKGESATLYIPSGLAYGSAARGDDIPANANLIFDVKLVTF